MKSKQKYIILFLAMALAFFSLSVAGSNIQRMKNTAFSINSMRIVFIWQFFIYSFAGMIFGIENFYKEYKKSGYWKVNLPRLFIMGIPSLAIGIFNVLFYIIYRLPTFIINTLISYNLIVNFMQMLLGYTIITSLFKAEEIPAEIDVKQQY